MAEQSKKLLGLIQYLVFGMFIFLFLSLISPISMAAFTEVLEPITLKVQDNETVYLGKVGPGQTIDIVVKGEAPEGTGRYNLGGRWQILRILEIPKGWTGFNSAEMAIKMKAIVKVAENAPDGEYTIKLRLEEDTTEQQELGSVTFFAKVKVSKDVMDSGVVDNRIEAGVGQPARYKIVIVNTGSASDVFEISSTGVPTWEFEKAIHIPAGKAITTFYEIVANEEKEYKPVLTIKSKSSEDIIEVHNLQLTVKSNVIGDIIATKNGVLVFPIILEPLYSLLGIIGYSI